MANTTAGPSAEIVIPHITLEKAVALLGHIPWADDGEGMGPMLEQVLAAETWEDIAAPWQKSAMESIIGHDIWVTDIVKRESDYDTPLGCYLIVRGETSGSGLPVVFSTGSIMLCVQLARLTQIGALPACVEVVSVPSRVKGRDASYHLVVKGVNPNSKGDA